MVIKLKRTRTKSHCLQTPIPEALLRVSAFGVNDVPHCNSTHTNGCCRNQCDDYDQSPARNASSTSPSDRDDTTPSLQDENNISNTDEECIQDEECEPFTTNTNFEPMTNIFQNHPRFSYASAAKARVN